MARNRPEKIENVARDMDSLNAALNAEGDLTCVLLGASVIDRCLQSLLSRFFIDGNTSDSLLDSVKGKLGELRIRTDLAYCLGLIPKALKNNLATIGEIRNRFAHRHFEMRFSEPEIVELCAKLTFPRAAAKRIDESGNVSVPDDPWKPIRNDARSRFIACTAIAVTLLSAKGITLEKRPNVSDW